MTSKRSLVLCSALSSVAAVSTLGCGSSNTPGSPTPGAAATTGASGTTASPTGGAAPITSGGGAVAPSTGGASGGGAVTPGTGGAPPAGAGAAGTPAVPAAGSAGTQPAGAGASAGGAAPTAGAGGAMGAGAGGTPPMAGAAGTSATPAACTISIVSSEVSSAIPTVGIVEFTSDLAGMDAARIEFGLDTNYGMTAPVDLAEPSYRTLLLGMKAGRDYNYRIVASAAGSECASENFTITTGPQATSLPSIDVNTPNPEALYGGFLMTGQYASGGGGGGFGGGGGGGGSPAYIIDADGDFVWWYTHNADVTNARMSYDGKYMWIQSANVPETQGANVRRVSMDGLEDEDFTQQFTGANHVFAVLPDETVAFFAYGNNGCDDVKLRHPDGSVETLINAQDAHGASGACHLNGIDYSPMDDSLVFSDLDHSNITKITLGGQVVWVLGGPTSQFTGEGSSWDREHGIDVLDVDRILFFNNGGLGGGGGSLALEVQLDLNAMTASIPWQYAAQPSIDNQIMGDVQRLDNGNTIVAYSTQGVLHEVDANGGLVQELTWGLGGAFGYIIKRATLYGPPPR